MQKKITLIMPVYNEEKRLYDSLIPILKEKKFHEVIVVDDGSTDKTSSKISKLKKKYQFKLIVKDNGGKGSAIRAGIECATGSHIAIMDADTEYSRYDLYKAADNANGVAVFGSRFLNNPELPRGMRIRNAVANLALSWLVNKVSGATLTDTMTCIKVFPNTIKDLKENGFQIECEIAIKLRKQNVIIKEIPIGYNGRTVEQGKKIKAKDFAKCVLSIARHGLWQR